MGGNYVIVANCCVRAGPFLKSDKNRHIATRKLWFWFGFALKTVFGFGLKTVTALYIMNVFCNYYLFVACLVM